ncbi:MAG: response regulator transcription factor [Tabrizicola sp.]|nr:response regulator transcription factor [Tabrizicola sp.]
MRTRNLVALIAAVVFGLLAFDISRETGPLDAAEVAVDLIEKLVLALAMAAVAWTVQGLREVQEVQTALENNLARSLAQGELWRAARQDEIAALGRAIEDQFRAWRLTPAEIDIAGLMLKGVSLKDIALVRDTSEATIRQQTQGIYRKSGLSGRAELSAYFLESLFTVAEDRRHTRPGLTVVG